MNVATTCPGETPAPAPDRAALQPIVRLLDGAVLGFEYLRGRMQDPQPAPAHLTGDWALDTPGWSAVGDGLAFAVPARPATLFLPISISSLLTPDAPERLANLAGGADAEPMNVVLEIGEPVPPADVAELRRVIGELRRRGFRIAITNVGVRHASLFVLAEVRPDFVKIAPDVVRQVHSSDPRRAMVVSLLSLATHISARVIAEGIGGQHDLESLVTLGIQFGQGPHLTDEGVAASAGTRGAGVESFSPYAPELIHAGPRVVRKRTSLPHALSSAAMALQAEHNPDRILAVIAEQLSLVVPVDDLSIYMAEHANHRFVPVFATGSQTAEVMADAFSMSVGLTGWAFALGTPQNLANAGAHPSAATVPNTPFEHESQLLIPLVAGDHKLGMLNCRRNGLNRFTDEDLEAASLFGHTAAAAWHNALLYEELARNAMTDSLTGLFNSRWLREAGEREIADSRRRNAPLSVVLLDLDYFKRINDSGGHAAGDVVLQRVAEELRRTTRAGDAPVRLGGEEFILLLRDTDAAGALHVGSELRRIIATIPIPPECRGIERVTASVGVASFPEDGSTLAAVVRAADVAMYVAKNDGRDRVVGAAGAGMLHRSTA